MALSSDEKLKNFAGEAMNEAKKISGEIREQNERETREKLEEGEKKTNAKINNYIRHETEAIKKEKSLEISQAEIKAKQEYFKYIDSVSSRVFEAVAAKLREFARSAEYIDYLTRCCVNVMEKTGTAISVSYMPKDEDIVAGAVKNKLGGQISGDISRAEFVKDEAIKTGGLRFFEREKNLFVNDVFDEKTERAKEQQHAIIGPYFTGVK